MSIRLYDTPARQVRDFVPLREGEPLPVALPHRQRLASDASVAQAAE